MNDQRFVFFEFERDVSLRRQKRLLARIIGRNEMQIRLGDFDIITENLIKTDAQGFNARSFAFAFFHLRQKSFAVA